MGRPPGGCAIGDNGVSLATVTDPANGAILMERVARVDGGASAADRRDGPDADAILDAFLSYLAEAGIDPYPAQEEAILELVAGHHVVLKTPTGSGKSLVAVAMCFRAMCRGERFVYTCPIKALVSEKFFDLCALFGAEHVGMLTGDASINHDAPIICCTAEVLANMALCEGTASDVDHVVMDEFHYYGDPDRGIAWQLPLLTLPDATFLLMSATLGDVGTIVDHMADYTEREVRIVSSAERPVPLDFEYSEFPLHQTVASLLESGRTPAYVVSFTQRECGELAQALSSFQLSTREQREAITRAIGGFRFDSPFGSDIKRILRNGIGLHHAGLLPKYRRLVERLAQEGLLSVICGTDTLGVGVNVPIRTVVFTKLCKYDGEQVRRLSARDFKQIAGRAGRKGFDDRGTVICLAPAHVIENRQLEAKAAGDPKKRKKLSFKKPPDKGYVHWDEAVFRQLIERDPEPLVSRFAVTHGMLLILCKHGADLRHGGYGELVRLIAECHDRDVQKRQHRRHAKKVFRSLLGAEVVSVQRRAGGHGSQVRVSEDLQEDFSLHHSLSLYLLAALPELDATGDTFAVDVVSLVESVLEHPRAVLYAQERKLKDELMARLKADKVEYEQRMDELERVSYPKPNAEWIYDTFNAFARKHPWLSDDNIRPKSVVRDMYEQYASFSEYVKRYGLKGSEGVLLRYLSDGYKALLQEVPESYVDEALLDVIGFLRATLERVDSSLLQEWEQLRDGAGRPELDEPQAVDIRRDRKALRARVRAEVHLILKALSERDFEEAANSIRHDPDDPWDAERIERALAPYFEVYETLPFDHRARLADRTILDEVGPGRFRLRQRLADPADDDMWFLEADIDLGDGAPGEGPILRLVTIGD